VAPRVTQSSLDARAASAHRGLSGAATDAAYVLRGEGAASGGPTVVRSAGHWQRRTAALGKRELLERVECANQGPLSRPTDLGRLLAGCVSWQASRQAAFRRQERSFFSYRFRRACGSLQSAKCGRTPPSLRAAVQRRCRPVAASRARAKRTSADVAGRPWEDIRYECSIRCRPGKVSGLVIAPHLVR
jgi:hypothetical protein